MVDEDNIPPEDMATLAYSRNTLNGQRGMRLAYRQVTVTLRWQDDEDGNNDLDRFVKHMPAILEEWRGELDIKREVDGLQAELDEFFGDDE